MRVRALAMVLAVVSVLCVSSALALGSERVTCALPGKNDDASALNLADKAAICLVQKKPAEAGRLFYAHAIRMRALAKMDPSPGGWAQSADKVQKQLGAPVNQWLGGDVDEWMAAIEWALAWDQSAPWSEGSEQAIKTGVGLSGLSVARGESRGALRRLAADLSALDRQKLKKAREKSGLDKRSIR